MLLTAGAACGLALGGLSTIDATATSSATIPAPTTITLPTTTIQGPTWSGSWSATSPPIAGIPFTLSLQLTDGNVRYDDLKENLTGFGSGLTVQSVQTTDGSCPFVAGNSSYTCDLGGVNPGDQITITVSVLASSSGSFQVNNTSSPVGPLSHFPFTVAAQSADLAVRVPAVTLRPKVGHSARVGVTVLNNGPVATTSTSLDVTVPSNTKLVTTTGSCSGKPLVCTIGGLGMGASDLVVLTLSAVKPGTGHLVATVSGSLPDAVAGNNSGSLAVIVPPKPKKKH